MIQVQAVAKKEGAIEVELNANHTAQPPASPPKQLLKRKRRKSRSLSISENCKEKRKFKGTPGAVAAVAAAVAVAADNPEDIDYSQPSTSSSVRGPTKTGLVKKKKVLRKRSATNVLQKKKRITLTEL